jgi:hypothetical protein
MQNLFRYFKLNHPIQLGPKGLFKIGNGGKPLLKPEKFDCILIGDLFHRLRT